MAGFIGGLVGGNPPNAPTLPPPPSGGGFIGGIIGGNPPIPPNPPSTGGFIGGIIPRPPRPPKPPTSGGFIGGGFIGRPTPGPRGGRVPYHTHSIETSGPNSRRNKMVFPRPMPTNTPGILPGTTHTSIPRPIKPLPSNPVPVMRNASGCGANYSNASGCGLWMCDQY